MELADERGGVPLDQLITRAIEAGPPGADDAWSAFAGGAVPRALALQVPAVRRAVSLIGNTIGTLPLVRWRGTDQLDGTPFLDQPEGFRCRYNTMAATVGDLVLHRYAWWRVLRRDYLGWPLEVVRLEPEYVSVQRLFGTDEVERVYATYRGREVPPDDLICFEGPDEGLLQLGRGEILTALALEAAANRYASPTMPTGVLKQRGQYGLTDDEIDALLTKWETSRRARTTAYLNEGIEYDPVAASPAELQLVEGREESAVQIARLCGIPPRYMNVTAGDSMTYSTLESERRDLIELTLTPYMEPITGRLSMSDRNGSPRGVRVGFSLETFGRGAPLDRAQRYATLIPLGVMSVQEARDAEDDLTGAAPRPRPVPAEPQNEAMPVQPRRVADQAEPEVAQARGSRVLVRCSGDTSPSPELRLTAAVSAVTAARGAGDAAAWSSSWKAVPASDGCRSA
ncbi:phage portal protein [Yinghuangia soli]|uniref:Phage portal protein n=1 Tax=Yinghuangia soli TaxID=2908204 RepID=A0AA41PXC4_9ACTN|nr:phage portal protein [Yinghuangia soli]MCF2526941.1 phage portal protein [Yinghuangia soli]